MQVCGMPRFHPSARHGIGGISLGADAVESAKKGCNSLKIW